MESKNTHTRGKQRLALDITLRRNPAPATQQTQKLDQPNQDIHAPEAHKTQPRAKRLSINIGSQPKSSKSSRAKKQLAKVFIGILIIVSTGTALTVVLSSRSSAGEKSTTSTGSNRPVGNPEYQTVLPAGKSIDELGDWKRVSPPGGDPVFAYLDTIDDISVSVSQQPIPKSLKGNAEEQIAELAKKFNATSRIDADGTKVYIGTSAKGPQSAILTKNNLLILIKSQEKITDTSWAKYAKSLK